MRGLSQRSIRRIIVEKLPNRRVSEEAVLILKASLEQTAHYLLERAAQAHDHENVVRKQIGERPRVRLSARHLRIALGAENEQEQDGHA